MDKRSILVTGASSGMGKSIAQQFLMKNSYKVFVAARRIEKMQDLIEKGAIAVEMDVADDASVEKAIKEIDIHTDGIDILINNAGFGLYGAVEDVPISEAKYQLDVNLFGPARLVKAFAPYMREKGSGVIVNMSSMGGKIYTPLGAWYHASKHALEGWSDCLRLELSKFGIKVIIVEPGIISTEFGEVVGGPMLKHSGNGPYADMAKQIASATEASYKPGGATSPNVIAKLVVKAVESEKPKTRYVKGKFAGPMLFIRKWFGDRVFDKTVMSTVK